MTSPTGCAPRSYGFFFVILDIKGVSSVIFDKDEV